MQLRKLIGFKWLDLKDDAKVICRQNLPSTSKNQSMIIKIKNLRLRTIIGVFDWEAKIDREIIINAEITTNLTKPMQSDDLSDTINYDQIIVKMKNLVANNRFKLVEKLAQTLMDEILQDKRINKCKLEIDKVGVVENVDSFSVTIEQENK